MTHQPSEYAKQLQAESKRQRRVLVAVGSFGYSMVAAVVVGFIYALVNYLS